MIHVHRMDSHHCILRHEWKASQTFNADEPKALGTQNHHTGQKAAEYCAGVGVDSELRERVDVLGMLKGIPAEF